MKVLKYFVYLVFLLWTIFLFNSIWKGGDSLRSFASGVNVEMLRNGMVLLADKADSIKEETADFTAKIKGLFGDKNKGTAEEDSDRKK